MALFIIKMGKGSYVLVGQGAHRRDPSVVSSAVLFYVHFIYGSFLIFLNY